MKRSVVLASLSRDHHRALFVARTLRRATEQTALRYCELAELKRFAVDLS